MTLTPLKTFEWSLLKPGLPEVPCYHILDDTFFCWLRSHREHLTKPNVSRWSENSSILFTSGSTDFFLWKGSTLSHLLLQSYHFPAVFNAPLTKQHYFPGSAASPKHRGLAGYCCQEKKHLDDGGPRLWTHSCNHSRMHHSPAALEAGGSKPSEFICSLHRCRLPVRLLTTCPALPPSSLSPFL